MRPMRQNLRFPEMVRERLERVAKKMGVTMTAIIQEGTMIRLQQLEADIAVYESQRASRRTSQPIGLGLSMAPTIPPPSLPQPIKPAPPPASHSFNAHRFAAFIAGAKNATDRQLRTESVAAMIRDTSPSRAEAEAFTRALDEEIRDMESDEELAVFKGILP